MPQSYYWHKKPNRTPLECLRVVDDYIQKLRAQDKVWYLSGEIREWLKVRELILADIRAECRTKSC